MNHVALFEAGGTKTTLIVGVNDELRHYHLPGFNPNRYTPDFENELASLQLPLHLQIVFYGSGLVSELNKSKVRDILLKLNPKSVSVFDDQVGAARAIYENEHGLVGILGTGAFAAWYDGKQLIDRKGGHGYLIDDIGGGYELGKVIVSAWLNNDLPANADKMVADILKVNKHEFTTVYYREPDLHLIASIAGSLSALISDPQINRLISNYFKLYFDRHVHALIQKYGASFMGLVGGIASAYEEIIKHCAKDFGINQIKVCTRPAEQLFAYHVRYGF